MLSMQVMHEHRLIWRLCGIWHEHKQPIWYTIYAYLVYIMFYLVFPAFIGASILFTENLAAKVEILVVFPSTLTGLKGLFVACNKRKLRQLFTLLNQMDAYARTDLHRLIVERKLIESRQLVLVFCTQYVSTICASFIFTVLSNDRSFMWPSWYPMDYTNSSALYYGLLMFQFVASLYVAVLSTSLDIYGSVLYKVLGAHMDVLGMQLQQLGHLKDAASSMTAFDRLQCEHNARKCVEYHVLCIRFSNCLNRILSAQHLLLFLVSGLIVCGLEFQLMSIDPSEKLFDYVTHCMHLIAVLIQLFLPCFFGNYVKEKSTQLPRFIYESNWVDQRIRFKRSLIIITKQAQRPTTPDAGGLFAVDLLTFVSIMKTAYSLMAVLKHMEVEE